MGWNDIDTHAKGDGPHILRKEETAFWIANRTQFRLKYAFSENNPTFGPRWCLDVVCQDDDQPYRITLTSDSRRDTAFGRFAKLDREEIEELEPLYLRQILTKAGKPYHIVASTEDLKDAPAIDSKRFIGPPQENTEAAPSTQGTLPASQVHNGFSFYGEEDERQTVSPKRQAQLDLLATVCAAMGKTPEQVKSLVEKAGELSDQALADNISRGNEIVRAKKAAEAAAAKQTREDALFCLAMDEEPF